MVPEVTDPMDWVPEQLPENVTDGGNEYEPEAHEVQFADPAATAYLPAVQRVQALAPEPAYEPAGQVLQPDNAVDQIALNPE